MTDYKPYHTPIFTGTPLSLHDGQPLLDPTTYRGFVGALQYCTLTRPDISFPINRLCQFMHAPTTTHWQALKHLFWYLKATHSHGISFHSSSDFSLTIYTDVDWASYLDDRRSTGRYCAFLGPNLISWQSSKQKVVSRSSNKSEYQALTNAAAEISWLESLLREIGINLPSTPFLCDNISATYLAANSVFHARTKHVEIDYHFIRKCFMTSSLLLRFTPSEDQLADAFILALHTQHFLSLRTKLIVLPRPVHLQEDVKTITGLPLLCQLFSVYSHLNFFCNFLFSFSLYSLTRV